MGLHPQGADKRAQRCWCRVPRSCCLAWCALLACAPAPRTLHAACCFTASAVSCDAGRGKGAGRRLGMCSHDDAHGSAAGATAAGAMAWSGVLLQVHEVQGRRRAPTDAFYLALSAAPAARSEAACPASWAPPASSLPPGRGRLQGRLHGCHLSEGTAGAGPTSQQGAEYSRQQAAGRGGSQAALMRSCWLPRPTGCTPPKLTLAPGCILQRHLLGQLCGFGGGRKARASAEQPRLISHGQR